MAELEPMPANERKILELAAPPEPPPGAEARVLGHLSRSIAGAAVITTAKLVTVAAAMLTAGVGAGVAIDRALLPAAPPPPPPQIVERVVRVEVPVAVAVPVPVPAPAPAPKPSRDDQLRRERELIDTARSALLHADAPGALATLQIHEQQFASGRLSEERESLLIQALVLSGSREAAQKRADAFHRAWPNSLLGPLVDAAMEAAGTPQQEGMEHSK